jgi:hypothetical protein
LGLSALRETRTNKFLCSFLTYINARTGSEKGLNDKIDLAKARRETARLLILRILYAARPIEATEAIVLRILRDFRFDYTVDDVRRELDYLRSLGLAEAGQDELVGWWARLTVLGITTVDDNAPIPAGIARPPKPQGHSSRVRKNLFTYEKSFRTLR